MKRRCIYHWIDYPDASRELEILNVRHPDTDQNLCREVVNFVAQLRGMDLFKLPGVAESIDWSQALKGLGVKHLDADIVDDTLGVLLKYQDDIVKVRGQVAQSILEAVQQ